MKKFKLLFIITFLLMITSYAQEISIGTKHQLYSNVLHENRNVWIHLPNSYNDTLNSQEHYPVLYLLDGDWQFHSLVAIQEALSGGYYNYMPEMIIVGIVNTDRSRDLTPTNGKVIHNNKVIHETSGGADNFLSFLTEELRPYINNNFRTNGYNMLEGHSFGGLFTIYTLMTQPQLFNAYIANDPSLWWDNKYVYHLAEKNWDNLLLNNCTLYLSIANDEGSDTDKFEHTITIKNFAEKILDKQNKLRYKWNFFEEEDHGTISLPASYDAMKYIFEGICIPVKKIPGNPDLLKEHFRIVSENIGFKLSPSPQLIQNMIKYCKQVDELHSAEKLLKYMQELYPNNTNAQILSEECQQERDTNSDKS